MKRLEISVLFFTRSDFILIATLEIKENVFVPYMQSIEQFFIKKLNTI